jgi:Zn-dependent protease
MNKPAFLHPEDQPTTLGRIFGTPLLVKGITGLPLLEMAAWGILTYIAGLNKPGWSRSQRGVAGALTTIILFGSEWGHNLAHAAAAHRIGKPVDAIRIVWGTPLLIYYDINDQQVSPRQHIMRASGGPIFNALLVPVAWFARRVTREGSLAHYVANFALGTNSVLSTASLLPIPGIDGGPLLKWLLVESGKSREQADETVKKANLALGSGLTVAAGVAVRKQHRWLGAAIAAFAATSLAIGLGLLKE